jgi:hypothetical protein
MARDDFSPHALQAVLSIDKILSAFPPDDRLAIAAETVLGVLRELRLLGQNEPARQPRYDAVRGDVLAWLCRGIEALRFEKSH